MTSAPANSRNRVTITPRMKARISPPKEYRATHRLQVTDQSVRVQPARFFDNVPQLGQEMFLLRRREWDRRIQSGDADDWRVEIVESFLVNDGGDFSSDAAGSRVLVQKNDFVGFPDCLDDSFAIERGQRTQIDNLEFDSLFRQDCR